MRKEYTGSKDTLVSSFLDMVVLKWLCKSPGVDNQEAAGNESETRGEVRFGDKDLRVTSM